MQIMRIFKSFDLNSRKSVDSQSSLFEAIACSDMIKHVYSPIDLLDERTDLLKQGRYTVLLVPNLACWKKS
jgi:2-polyprenyl-3-methyl-5-hydroxy-6-metoxy-1,4-benzoquinol methylase